VGKEQATMIIVTYDAGTCSLDLFNWLSIGDCLAGEADLEARCLVSSFQTSSIIETASIYPNARYKI
jgi:hypothetical protein